MTTAIFVAIALLTTAFALTVPSANADPITLTVESNHILRRDADKFVGVNLNYIRDADANRLKARALDTALKDMGTRWLRYPGGEKSDYCLWAQSPYTKPHPISLGYYGTVAGTRMDFDEYIAHCRAVGAEPYVVVGYESEAHTGRTKAQWIESAAAWVKYANQTKHYGVRYWEVGNENWNNHKGTAEELAQIVTEFAHAMKASDPTVHIGASGNGNGWWSQFLPIAAPSLDFINLSLYNCWAWKGYDHFVQNPTEDTIGDVETALKAIDSYAPPADRARLKVIVSETNSKDYSDKGWPGTNTLGHTLVSFDTLGKCMAQPCVLTAMVWTTRWMNDGEAKNSQWYALGPDNEILPTGRAVALWGQFVQKDLVAVTGGSVAISAYASRSGDGRAMTVWVLNRGYNQVDNVRVVLPAAFHFRKAALYRLSGTGPEDASPQWGPVGTVSVSGNALPVLSYPSVSVTVISLTAKGNQ
jgi:alpha-N-arabinofuranosidase